ncbi:sorting nexin-19 isoform X1 [Orcinus orca]|uniref:sorting nexin-19 isoform X1 n=1 Tax=Orcinus orca TaxID=9733 RepID=UPI002112DB0E|nr:sorting nexin-19 isoform X1 [Orcinus orca]XP_033262892.2 sorting nexin-19 isoform X1 [Orcinus orca]XP_033262893.2 sorting nexin-19 isoform X1 [Orcinus orca]XP_033262894.2 sorting nexin-19 isoform X1 [Orcinus orca]XP_033262897.2 sorting nexin-19 isoform X1 [Orcinus orca]
MEEGAAGPGSPLPPAMKAETATAAQEPPAGPSLSHLLSSRKLVALGAVLGWLLVIHLLVNVWLLCLLSALLLVLGGWLGADAIVGPSGRLHLERFIPMAVCPPNPEAERQLEQEIDRTIRMVMRDFVSSWYRTVSQEPAFEEEMEAAMRGLVQELRRRMARVDSHALAQRVLTLCGCHLQSYLQAKEATTGKQSGTDEPSQLWEAYCQATAPHPAVQSPRAEVAYTRGIVNVLLQGLVPKPHLETRTGRHVVVELITCNVMLPLISKLSDPDWIHLVLVGIFSKARTGPAGVGKPLCAASALEQPSVPTSLPLIVEVQSLADARAPSPAPVLLNYSEPSHPSPEVEEGHEALEGDLGGVLEEREVGNSSSHFLQPLFLSEDAELESPLSELGKETIMLVNPGTFLSARIQDSLCALGGSQALESKDEEGSEGIEGAEAEEGPGTETETGLLVSMLNSCPEIQIDTADKDVEQGDVTSLTTLLASPERMCTPRPSCLEKDLTNGVSSLDPSLPQVLLSSSPPGPLSSATFSFEPLSSPDGPVIIQNLRITGTITAREHSGTGFHPYTLYTVKYETALDCESSSGLRQLAYHTVNRRYREFLNLQTRLEEKSDLRKFIKNVKGPKKLFPDLPFGNMDSDRVEARKSLLESFLKQLCAISEIANSEEMQEFLALNTDARIAFVKKPFMVSRIDKVVVSAIVDTLKTAFPRSEPQSPTEELSEAETESKPQPEGKKATKSRLRFSSSKIAPALNITETHEKILYCLREGSVESEILSMSGMESFIEKQTKLLETQPAEAPGKDSEQISKGCVDDCVSGAAVPAQDLSNSDPGTETELADTALDLLLLLLMEQWRWLCTENVQKVIHLIFGTLIQRWLEVQVATLTCPQRWVQYLRLLQESIWPGGLLPEYPRPVRTQEQKAAAEKQALQSLMGVLPDIVVEILGVNKCRLSWSLVLESLRQPLINRHLIYCLWDIILEFLDLSASAEESAITSSAADTPGSPKKMGISP